MGCTINLNGHEAPSTQRPFPRLLTPTDCDILKKQDVARSLVIALHLPDSRLLLHKRLEACARPSLVFSISDLDLCKFKSLVQVAIAPDPAIPI